MTDQANDAKDSPAPNSRKVIYAAIVANLGIAAAKFTVAAMTGSAAMLAEGIHSAVDSGNELLLLVGEKVAARAPDARHPFGYGKAVYFWALIVALSVFTLGGGLSIFNGIQNMRAPEALTDPFWNYVVLGVAFLFEGYSWNVSRRALNSRRRPGATLWQTVKASKDASTFTVFIEDTAALLGIVVAAGGIFLGHLFDNPYIDPAASVVVGLLLIGAAVTLARETGALLVGESVGAEQTAKLRAIFSADPAIDSIGELMTMQLGPDDVLLTAAVRFKRGMRIDEVDVAIARLERSVAAFNPSIRRVYFEAEAIRSAMR